MIVDAKGKPISRPQAPPSTAPSKEKIAYLKAMAEYQKAIRSLLK